MENQEKHICEYCCKEHDGSYGSGRFCSDHCRRAYCAKQRKFYKCNWPKNKLKEGGWTSNCGQTFLTRKLLRLHRKDCEECKRISYKKQGETYKKYVKEGKIKLYWTGKTIPEEMRIRISESMKKAHEEGRAWNIGKSRWNNEPSYLEKWFMTVIENEFEDKNYVREYPFHKFSLDFAWVEKRICIEIDGEQHERFEDQKLRDKEKDELLAKEGWKELRIKWKDCCNNPKYYIQLAKELFKHSIE